jgi:hypothetical protein
MILYFVSSTIKLNGSQIFGEIAKKAVRQDKDGYYFKKEEYQQFKMLISLGKKKKHGKTGCKDCGKSMKLRLFIKEPSQRIDFRGFL